MRFTRPITLGAILLLAQLSALGAELAVLRNGFSIRFEHKEQTGNVIRLYTGTGYVDVASEQIASFEAEEAPVPEPAAANIAPAAGQPAAKPVSIMPAQVVPDAASIQTAAPAQTAASTQAAGAVDLDQVILEASRKNRLDPDFVSSVIKAESNFKPHAVSPKGARGLMQLMPATASQLGVADAFDPRANVEAGTAHLSALLDQYHDDPIKALAAYNAGAHRVKQYNGVPPYRETRNYISKIVRDFNAKKRAQMQAGGPSQHAAAASGKAKPAAVPAKAVNSRSQRKSKPQQAQISKPASPA
jgi:soluble lytic murein transglycosylase-like protein